MTASELAASQQPAVSEAPSRPWSRIELVGLVILIGSAVMLFVNPKALGDFFDAAINEARPIIVDVFLTGYVGFAIIASVIAGRLLERLGMTDALLRIFVPILSRMGVNPTVVAPGVYNIIGDINASGIIAGPVTKKSGATIHEQKIAVATMVQVQQSLATFILGIVAVTAVGVWAFPVVLLAVFAPLVVVPFVLSKTIYRDVRPVKITELPRFTPTGNLLEVLYDSAQEGVRLLLLVIIPAAGAFYALVGALKYLGIWQPFESAVSSVLSFALIDPVSGIQSIFVAPTLAMATLLESTGVPATHVVGSFVLASSGLPLSVIFGQIPLVWSEASDLSKTQAIEAAVVGMVLRVLTAVGIAALSVVLLFQP
jgi:hypothetical protein